MAMQVADLEAVLKLNDKDYKKGMQDAQNLSKKTTDKISNDIFTMNNIIKAGFAKLAYEGTQAFIGLGKAAINYTSDLKELENVLSVTFGDRMNAVALNADAMGRAMGRSSLQIRGAVAQAGALGKGLGFVGEDLEQMSINLAKTAVDMGSFFNVADDEAFTALRAALTGETENMKRFGIVMTENNLKAYALAKGIKVLWKDMTEAEKTQVRYNYMLEKTSFFAGDAERTINSTANKTKVLKANLGDLYGEVGKNLEPIWNEFLTNLNDTVVAITENEKATLGLTSAFQALGKVAGGVTWITKNFILGIQNIANLIGEPFRQINVVKDFAKVSKDFNKVSDSWLKNNKDFIDEVNRQYTIDLQNSTNHTDKLKAEYERKLKILNEYNKNAVDGTKKANDEILRLNNLGSGNMTLGAKPKELGMIKEQDYKTVLDMMKTGKLDYSKLSISNIKGINKGYEKAYQDMVRQLVVGAGKFGTTLSWLENATALGGPKSVGAVKDVSTDTTLNDWTSKIVGGKGTSTDTLTLEKLQSNYQAELKAFEEYAKQRKLTEEEKNQQLLQINDSYAKQAIDNGWLEYANKLSANANSLENAIEFAEETKQYNELRLENEKKYKQAELDLTEETNKEALELLGIFADESSEIIKKRAEDEKNKIQNLANVFSETSKITGELATLFEDDLLNAMSSLISAGGNFATSLMSGNVLGSISSGLALVNQLDSFLNDDGANKQQEEANTKFKEAVESFKKSVEEFSLGQKISFAKLEKPSNLVGAITGTGEKGTQLWESMLTGGGASFLDLLKGDFKASNASLDTTSLQQQLANAGYGGIDVNAIFGKYAQMDSYRNWYGKKESYISGYDTAGAMAEITKLIEEAWQSNLEGFAQALSLSSQDFIGNMVDVFKNGGSISESVNDMFTNAVIEAFFNQELFETLNKNLSGAISEIIIGELSTEGIDLGMDFKGMSPGEMIEAYTKIYGASSDKLKEILEQLGLAASSATDQLNQVSTKNLPSGLKVASAEFQATNSSYGQTYQIIYQIENNYSKDFSEMVATAQNKSRFNQTGNARRGY